VAAWDCDTANVHDTSFQHLIQRFEDQMVILGDMGFHAREGDHSNLKLCERGEWNERMMVETVYLTVGRICVSLRAPQV